MGYFAPERWKDEHLPLHEIALTPQSLDRQPIEVVSTIVHEMVHEWQQEYGRPSRSGYHNKEWGNKMIEIGLHPSNTGKVGGKQTGQQMTHYVIDGGRFEIAFNAMPHEFLIPFKSRIQNESTKKSPVSKDKIKYSCNCSNVWGKSGLTLFCANCHSDFVSYETKKRFDINLTRSDVLTLDSNNSKESSPYSTMQTVFHENHSLIER